MIRLLDIFLSFFGLFVFSPILFLVMTLGYFDTRSPLFFQKRVGVNKKIFVLVKFRTMRVDADSVGTHLSDPSFITPLGQFLRISKIDELPQLWNVLKGEMSLVGPRPCLPNQKKLIDERVKRGIYGVRPGITGLAQIQGIDMSTPKLLAQTDLKMIKKMSFFYYCYYILLTAFHILNKNFNLKF